MKKKIYTRQQLIDMLWEMKNETGRQPTVKDLPEGMLQHYRSEFGKWCYALQESGIKPRSQEAIERKRIRKKEKRKKRRRAAQERAKAAGAGESKTDETEKQMD